MSTATKPIAFLAAQAGYNLSPAVLKSQAGYYIGTFDFNAGPVSRESVRYWPTKQAAQAALDTGVWAQRQHC